MFSLCNVVYYDGESAYTTQFILQTFYETVSDDYRLTGHSKEKLEKYLEGNGELLHIDIIMPALDLEDIVSMKSGEYVCTLFRFGEGAQYACYYRFKEMYF